MILKYKYQYYKRMRILKKVMKSLSQQDQLKRGKDLDEALQQIFEVFKLSNKLQSLLFQQFDKNQLAEVQLQQFFERCSQFFGKEYRVEQKGQRNQLQRFVLKAKICLDGYINRAKNYVYINTRFLNSHLTQLQDFVHSQNLQLSLQKIHHLFRIQKNYLELLVAFLLQNFHSPYFRIHPLLSLAQFVPQHCSHSIEETVCETAQIKAVASVIVMQKKVRFVNEQEDNNFRSITNICEKSIKSKKSQRLIKKKSIRVKSSKLSRSFHQQSFFEQHNSRMQTSKGKSVLTKQTSKAKFSQRKRNCSISNQRKLSLTRSLNKPLRNTSVVRLRKNAKECQIFKVNTIIF